LIFKRRYPETAGNKRKYGAFPALFAAPTCPP
jgi:hypothetical protein